MTESYRTVPDRPTIVVRSATPADVPDMARLFHETVHSINARDYSARQLRAWSPGIVPAEQWRQRQAGLHVWVATRADVLVGFAELDTAGIIDCFFVSHRHQRRGVGVHLMATLLDNAHRLRLPRVEADVSLTAFHFFRSQGFRSLGEQTATRRGVRFRQFRMCRLLQADADFGPAPPP